MTVDSDMCIGVSSSHFEAIQTGHMKAVVVHEDTKVQVNDIWTLHEGNTGDWQRVRVLFVEEFQGIQIFSFIRLNRGKDDGNTQTEI